MYVDIATELMHQELKTIFGGLVKNLRFEHADTSGYWFTFELVNDDRRQTWCIRPEEVKKAVEHTRKKITRCGEYKKPVKPQAPPPNGGSLEEPEKGAFNHEYLQI